MATKFAVKETSVSTEPCFSLIYRSHSLLPEKSDGGEKALAEILSTSRSNNTSLGITGALVLYEYKGRFAQVLEGPEKAVQDLFTKIKSDPRHNNVNIVESGESPERLFSRWAMTLVVEHGESDIPLMATSGGIAEAAPWRLTAGQEQVLTKLRDLTRSYGRAF